MALSLLSLVAGIVGIHLVGAVVGRCLPKGVGVAGVPIGSALVAGVIRVKLVGPVVCCLLAHFLSGRHG